MYNNEDVDMSDIRDLWHKIEEFAKCGGLLPLHIKSNFMFDKMQSKKDKAFGSPEKKNKINNIKILRKDANEI